MPTSRELRGGRARLGDASGVTLIELVISISIVAIAVTGTLLSISRSVRSSADPLIVHQALAVGEAYLEEVLLKEYYDPNLGAGGGVCPMSEASRDLYDNLCDYDGLADAGARDQNNVAVVGLEGYNVAIAVEETTATLGALTGDPDVVRVDVTVSNGNVVNLTLSGYRTNY